MTVVSMQVKILSLLSLEVTLRKSSDNHSCNLPPGGHVPLVGVDVVMDSAALNGTNRVVLDGVLSPKECQSLLQLATVRTEEGEKCTRCLLTDAQV